MDRFGGDITIYTRILQMTDCTELQREFGRADEISKQLEPGTQEDQVSIGYRTAAENRMKDVECEGDLQEGRPTIHHEGHEGTQRFQIKLHEHRAETRGIPS